MLGNNNTKGRVERGHLVQGGLAGSAGLDLELETLLDLGSALLNPVHQTPVVLSAHL